MKPKVSIIIVHWNTPAHLDRLLKKLETTESIEIIIVDNNSKKKLSDISKKIPNVVYVENPYNRGYAFACNQGSLFAKGEWLLFLNPDVEIDNTFVNALTLEAEEKKYDAASPLSEKGNYDNPLPSFASLAVEFSPLSKYIPLSVFSKKTLFGGCLLIKTDVFREVGGWDERFFVWFEDSDLTKRLYDAKKNVGWLSSKIPHTGGASFNNLTQKQQFNMFFQSLSIYAQKHFSRTAQKALTLLTERFWYGHLYPQSHEGISLVVPNMRFDILETFLEKNGDVLNTVEEVIVVSSALRSEVLWKLRKKNPEIRFITTIQNKGFAHTVNIGMRAATGKYIGTCNDDTLLNKDSFAYINTAPAAAGALNPLIYKTDGSIESAGIRVLSKGKAEPITALPTDDFTEVDATNGACVLYARTALEKVGLFDEAFGSYLEDIDLSLRIKKAGYKNFVAKNASVIHRQHQTSQSMGSKKQWLDLVNWVRVIVKNWSLLQLTIYAPILILERIRNTSGLLKSLCRRIK